MFSNFYQSTGGAPAMPPGTERSVLQSSPIHLLQNRCKFAPSPLKKKVRDETNMMHAVASMRWIRQRTRDLATPTPLRLKCSAIVRKGKYLPNLGCPKPYQVPNTGRMAPDDTAGIKWLQTSNNDVYLSLLNLTQLP